MGECENCDKNPAVNSESSCGENPENNPMTFECIAKKSKGKNLIGVYKADVDNLGFLFIDGFERSDEVNKYTVSRITTLSRMLEMFFSGYINRMMSEKYKFVYSLFSGGDDLFLIGEWDSIMKMSIDINADFKRYVGFNDSFTISSALILEKPKHPVSQIAEEAEHCLELSKNRIGNFYKCPKSKDDTSVRESKNQITFFNEQIKWDDFKMLVEEANYIYELIIKEDIVNINQLRRLMAYSEMYKVFSREKSIKNLKYIPMLAYDINRNYKIKDSDSMEKKKFYEWVYSLRKKTVDNRRLYFMNVISGLALLKYNRGSDNSGKRA
jgi:CRISPR-associated protein Csm1